MLGKLKRNISTILANPRMMAAYSRWLMSRGRMEECTHFSAKISGFENFSNFWGTVCKIPSRQQFEFFASLVEPGDVCMDVGANIGSFTAIFGKLLPNHVIYAFEPAPNTCEILKSNIKLNKLSHAYAHQLALSESIGIVRFSNEPSISQRNHIIQSTEMDQVLSSCEVQTTTLVEFCSKLDIPSIGFVKIDCEGAEPMVLRGSRSLLEEKRIRALLVEVCVRNLRSFNFAVDDLINAIAGTGYRFHRLSNNGQIHEPLTDCEVKQVESDDLLLLPV